jgi:two-component system, LytTR family, response regulator
MLRSLIIDDETNASDKLAILLKRYCADTVEVVEVCDGAQAGLDAIAKHDPDLVFLDVEMPVMTGFDMLRKVGKPHFDVIFTTAYDHYAIKAIKFAAIDYLLKPIDIDQLKEAIGRVLEKRQQSGASARVEQLMENTRPGAQLSSLSIPGRDGFEMVKLDDIVWCEAVNYYTVFHLAGNASAGATQLVATRTLKDFEEMLDGLGFVRIHHSHLINLGHLVRYIKGAGGQVVMSDGRTLDVSRRKKDELMARIENRA